MVIDIIKIINNLQYSIVSVRNRLHIIFKRHSLIVKTVIHKFSTFNDLYLMFILSY